MDERWYAVYTKPRWEKRVAQNLTIASIENYCPLHKVMRLWSDRKKLVQVPLFPSYVFVKVTEAQLNLVRKTEGIINLVHWLGKPASIKDDEIEAIRAFLDKNKTVRLEKLSVNDQIKITDGSLINKQATVVAIKNNSIRVALPSLGYILYAEVEKSSVVKLAE